MNRKEPILINLKKNQYFATLLGFLRLALYVQYNTFIMKWGSFQVSRELSYILHLLRSSTDFLNFFFF